MLAPMYIHQWKGLTAGGVVARNLLPPERGAYGWKSPRRTTKNMEYPQLD